MLEQLCPTIGIVSLGRIVFHGSIPATRDPARLPVCIGCRIFRYRLDGKIGRHNFDARIFERMNTETKLQGCNVSCSRLRGEYLHARVAFVSVMKLDDSQRTRHDFLSVQYIVAGL